MTIFITVVFSIQSAYTNKDYVKNKLVVVCIVSGSSFPLMIRSIYILDWGASKFCVLLKGAVTEKKRLRNDAIDSFIDKR